MIQYEVENEKVLIRRESEEIVKWTSVCKNEQTKENAWEKKGKKEGNSKSPHLECEEGVCGGGGPLEWGVRGGGGWTPRIGDTPWVHGERGGE